MTSTVDLSEIVEREKRAAAIDEASHLVLCTKFGGVASARIWRNESGDTGQKAWLGTCRVLAFPGAAYRPASARSKFGIMRRPPGRWPLYLGMAGYLGELIAQGVDDWDWFESWGTAIWLGEISPTDLALVEMSGIQPTEHTTIKTGEYLRRYWSEIQIEADRLLDGCDC